MPVKSVSSATRCPVCARKVLVAERTDGERPRLMIDCRRCGRLKIASPAISKLRHGLKTRELRDRASTIIRRSVINIADDTGLDLDEILVNTIIEIAENNLKVGISYLLLAVRRANGKAKIGVDSVAALIGLSNADQVLTYLEDAAQKKQLTYTYDAALRIYALIVGKIADAPTQIDRPGIRPIGVAPIYVRSISLTNVKCFSSKQTMDFGIPSGKVARWNVILGENGVGKTTILQAIAALFPIEEQKDKHREPATPSDLLGRFPRSSDSPSEIAVSYCLAGLGRPVQEDIPAFAWANRDIGASMADMLIKYQQFNVSSKIYHAYSYGQTKREFGSPSLIAGYGAGRLAAGDWSTQRGFGASPILNLFTPAMPLRSPEQWIIRTDYIDRVAGAVTARFVEIKRAILQLLPDIEDILIEVSSSDEAQPLLRFVTALGSVAFEDLSLGYQSTLSWVIDLMSKMYDAYAHSINPLAEPAVAIVDEIDLHLHPKWQRVVMLQLNRVFPQTQFIVTTHSPLTVLGAPDANIFVLRRKNKSIVIEKESKSVSGWRADQILTSDLFDLDTARSVETEKILKARRTLLAKETLTPRDEQKLDMLERELESIPATESIEDSDAMRLIRQAAKRLREGAHRR